ncbi:MAG: glycosyltransferase family 39 protein [Planctomycetota bacterium]|nr:glycosyltransferase family 39 protein [Planctomycetota bacterium]
MATGAETSMVGVHASSRRARGLWAGVLLVVVCVLAHVPGLWSLPAVDRDESRFAQASRQMRESGTIEGWLVPRVQDRPRLNKPPLIYWLQAGSAHAALKLQKLADMPLGDSPPTDVPDAWNLRAADAIWMYRLPSIAAALLAVLFTWRAGLRLFDPSAAWLGALLLALCPLVIWESKQARADMLLLACTSLALWGLARAAPAALRARTDWPGVVLLWAGVALGVLAKGPITPMIVLTALAMVAIVVRRAGWLWRLHIPLGLVVTLGLIGAWVFGVSSEIGWDRYRDIVWDETIGRSVQSKEGHWGPPGYHLVLLTALFWPGSLLTAAAFVRAWRKGVRFKRSGELLCFAWVAPAWLIFELVSTKLPHYTLPLYPAVALLSARALLAAATGSLAAARQRGMRLGVEIWTLVGLVIAAGPLTVWWATANLGSVDLVSQTTTLLAPLAALAAGLLAAGCVLRARAVLVRPLRRGEIPAFVRAQILACVASASVGVAIIGLVLPSLAPLWNSRAIIKLVGSIDASRSRPLASVGYHEDSLIFETSGKVVRLNHDQWRQWLNDNPVGIVVLPREQWEAELQAFRARIERRGEAPGEQSETASPSVPRLLGALGGFNYSNGKRVELVLIERGTP